MKNLLTHFLLLLVGLTGDLVAESATDCAQGKSACCCQLQAVADQPAVVAEQPKSHPLKGVIIGVMVDKTALLVKHEEVPGVMRAMTMMFKVDPAVLENVKRGDAIKALMSRRADGWWLTEVEVVTPVGKS